MAEFLTINRDGSWQPIQPSSTGVSGGKPSASLIWLEAESADAAGGKLVATQTAAAVPGFSGRGHVTGFPVQPEHAAAYYAVQKSCTNCVKRASPGSVTVLAQVAHDQDCRLKVRYSADQDTRLHVFVNREIIKANAATWNDVWAKARGQKFETFDLGIVLLNAGDNHIQLHSRDNADIRLDAFELTPPYPR